MLMPLVLCLALGAEVAPPKPFTQAASVEGVTEYRLPNGLKVLLVPDDSVSTVFVNLTVLVGSRHEGYGEKGMAHLLEHLLFKGSTKYKDPKKEMGSRGAQWNGTTSQDRTNYFEMLPATDANTEFAIRFEADRLVNSFVDKKDLDTEMTVVRNEFERSENSSMGVLYTRVRAIAFPWHNYGRSVIGTRADIERVPVENLKAFYKRYYQPDNAVLVLSGKFDAAKAFKWIGDSFGKIPKPTRVLGRTFTEEPVQDGERYVSVRRVGGTPALTAAWRIPASTDPDYPALMVLQGVLGDEPQGRVHQTLVEGKKAAMARCDVDQLYDPGLFQCVVELKPSDTMQGAREALLTLLEAPKPITQAEVDRSRTGWVSQIEQFLQRSDSVGMWLSEWAAMGDWRMIYVQRDRLKTVTLDDVQRVWAKYLKPQNRSLGEYYPTAKPDRAEIPLAADFGPLVNNYKGGEAVAKGEVFDASPKNIEARTRRLALANGAKVALLPKKTRAQTVNVAMELRYGTQDSLKGLQPAAEATGLLLNRGTRKLPYKELRNALERLRAQVNVSADGQVTRVVATAQRPQLAEVMAIMGDMLKEPAFDPKELEVARGEMLAELESEKDEPMAVGANELTRALTPLPKDHPEYVPSYPERIAQAKAVTLEQVKAFHARFYGAQNASIAVVGDFDPAEVERALGALFGAWTSKEPYALAKDPFVAIQPSAQTIPLPDKQSAWIGSGTTVQLTDSSPDYPALQLASFLLGGSASARLFVALREEKGLTYGAYAWLAARAETDRAMVETNVTYAPQNLGPVEQGLAAQLERWSTISKDELDRARSELLEGRKQGRSNDGRVASMLVSQGRLGRTMDWEEQLDAKYAALTPDQVSAAVKKLVDPKKVVTIKAGDFKTVAAPK